MVSWAFVRNIALSCVLWYTCAIELNDYAKKVGVCYETAWRWFKVGMICEHQMPTGTSIITRDEPTTSTTLVAIVYSPAPWLCGQRHAKHKTDMIIIRA